MSEEIRDRIAEVLARTDYERKDWSGCEGSRWERLPELVRIKRIELKQSYAEVLVRELGLADGRRLFAPAYREQTGIICTIGATTILPTDAQRAADIFQSAGEQTEIFVAYHDEYPWRRWDGDQ